MTSFLVTEAPADAVITLGATAATLTNLSVGQTATGTGTLTATDTSGSWTLQAQDLGPGVGHMVASAAGCTNSDSQLTNSLQVSITTSLSGVSTTTSLNLSATPQTVASASNAPMLTPTALTSNYTQVIPANEVMLTGCVYSITVTYTLQ